MKSHWRLVGGAHWRRPRCVTFSPDGLTLALTGRDQMIRLWDPVTARELLTLKGHQAPVHAAIVLSRRHPTRHRQPRRSDQALAGTLFADS